MKIDDLSEAALNEALKHGSNDVSAITSEIDENQVRFSNNSITLSNNVKNIELFLPG